MTLTMWRDCCCCEGIKRLEYKSIGKRDFQLFIDGKKFCSREPKGIVDAFACKTTGFNGVAKGM